MTPDDLDDEVLLYIVGQTDKRLFEAGVDIRHRQMEVIREVMQEFGYISFVTSGQGKPPILDRVERAFASIYRKQDIAIGGHIGVFMFRDVFARISVPHVYGRASIDPFQFVELTDVQKRILGTEPDQVAIFVDQFVDVSDIQYGTSEIKKPYSDMQLVGRFLGLARLHLHSASAVLTGGYDYRGAAQAALLATELGLKAGLGAFGMTEPEIKSEFSHYTDRMVSYLSGRWPTFDGERVARTVKRQPQYVSNRYSAEQPTRREVGDLVMGAQYIVAEIVRQVSNRDFRSCFTPVPVRAYPK